MAEWGSADIMRCNDCGAMWQWMLVEVGDGCAMPSPQAETRPATKKIKARELRIGQRFLHNGEEAIKTNLKFNGVCLVTGCMVHLPDSEVVEAFDE